MIRIKIKDEIMSFFNHLNYWTKAGGMYIKKSLSGVLYYRTLFKNKPQKITFTL